MKQEGHSSVNFAVGRGAGGLRPSTAGGEAGGRHQFQGSQWDMKPPVVCEKRGGGVS